jgi:PAS domain S-box-containing protein
MSAKTRTELLAELKALKRRLRRHEQALARLQKPLDSPRPEARARGRRAAAGAAAVQGYAELCRMLLAPDADIAVLLSSAGVIRTASGGAASVLGIAARELIGRLIYDCVAEEDRQGLKSCLEKARQRETSATTLTWTWPTRIPLEASAAAWPETAEAAWLLVLRSPRTGGGLRLASAPELASFFAHELNQPVASLLAAAQSCSRLARQKSNGALPEALEQLVVQAERTGELVRRLRDFARGVRTTRGPLDLHEAVRAALAEQEPELKRQGIAVELHLGSPHATVLANHTLIGQALTNLLRNAIEAMQETSPSRRNLTVRSASTGRDVEIEIADAGKGISVEGVKDLFEPFVSTKSHGTGLGLALTRAIVQAHGGRVWWKDHHGRGASFFVSLPLTTKEP